MQTHTAFQRIARSDDAPDESLRDEFIARRTNELVAQWRKDPKALAEAEAWTAGSFEPEHYSAVSLALHALHRIEPADLLGSDALANLYRLAKVDHDAIEAQLREMATVELERRAAAVLAVMDSCTDELEKQPGCYYTDAAKLQEARAAVAELIEAAAEMNRLAKGPAGGVSSSEKRAICARMDAALAAAGAQ